MRLFVTLVTSSLLAFVAHAADLKPMTAVYSVVRNGKAIGDATYTLTAIGDGTWTLTSITRGSAGMARLLSLDVREQSTFRWQDGHAQGIRYDYTQDATIIHKKRHMDFDWAASKALVVDNGKPLSYAIPAGTIDRSTVALVLGQMLASGAHVATLPVATQDHLEQQKFTAQGEEKIDVPAGKFNAIKIERTDAPGKARSWYAPAVTTLPLRVEQLQKDGAMIVMELKK